MGTRPIAEPSPNEEGTVDTAHATGPVMDEAKIEEFAERVGADQSIGVASVLVYIGDRLGLWEAMAEAGPVTGGELADRTGLDSRYLEEWLAAQASTDYVVYESDTGRFSLPPEHAAVLADDDSPAALVGGFEFQAGCWADADLVIEVFKTGEGIPWGRHDPRVLSGVYRFFRPLYDEGLIPRWLPSIEGMVSILEEGARVLDIGCGLGRSTIVMASEFPNSQFLGVDPDKKSIVQARRFAEEAGVDERTSFEVTRAEDDLGGDWDLISVFDAFHHFGDPAAAARRFREALSDRGVVMLVEPLSKDALVDNLEAAGPLYYSPSTLVCIPDALSQYGGAALGAQAGPARIAQILTEAGFSAVRVAEETDFNLIFEARP